MLDKKSSDTMSRNNCIADELSFLHRRRIVVGRLSLTSWSCVDGWILLDDSLSKAVLVFIRKRRGNFCQFSRRSSFEKSHYSEIFLIPSFALIWLRDFENRETFANFLFRVSEFSSFSFSVAHAWEETRRGKTFHKTTNLIFGNWWKIYFLREWVWSVSGHSLYS